MREAHFEAMKAACALITAGPAKGTGYLVDASCVVTCAHVIENIGSGGTVKVDFPSVSVEATVGKCDSAADAALLHLLTPMTSIAPLELAGSVSRKAPWDGYGFPGIAGGQGLPLEGAVMDPDSMDDKRAHVLLLKSEQLAAGQGAALHGFSGSPVLVQGFVVGHLKRYIKDNESPLRPAFGYVYATPAAAVLKLLGIEAARQTIDPPEPIFPAEDLPLHRVDDSYDVFISYRSTDRRRAEDLLSRLEGAGFKAFIDQREMLPGQPLSNTLQSAIGRSKSAVVLISKEWTESPWCQAEANVLWKLATENPDFRVVRVRLDDAPLPPFWESLLWLDFRGKYFEGLEFRRLQFALIGRVPPADDAAEVRVFKAVTQASDELIATLIAARAGGADRVHKIWKAWREQRMPDGPAHLFAAEILISLGDHKRALEVLSVAKPGDRADQLRALALGRLGRIDEAIEILKRCYDANRTPLDSETGGILGGRYKQRWLRSGETNTADLLASFETYRETYERTGAAYTGVNAAAMALEMGDKAESGRLARKVLATLENVKEQDLDHWNRATLAEAYLLQSDLTTAARWYGKAVAHAPELHQDIAVMRKQARRELRKLGFPRDALDKVLYVPRVAAFSGHMVDAPGRNPPRFPEEKVAAVRKAIADRLKKHGIGYGFSSAARGADLLFIEELKKRGACIHVCLPFPRDDFKKTSVGGDWNKRFDQALEGAKVEVEVLAPVLPPEDEQPAAYANCNREIFAEAQKRAELFDDEPILITVWNGSPGEGIGGTADAVRAWRLEGHEVDEIDISKI